MDSRVDDSSECSCEREIHVVSANVCFSCLRQRTRPSWHAWGLVININVRVHVAVSEVYEPRLSCHRRSLSSKHVKHAATVNSQENFLSRLRLCNRDIHALHKKISPGKRFKVKKIILRLKMIIQPDTWLPDHLFSLIDWLSLLRGFMKRSTNSSNEAQHDGESGSVKFLCYCGKIHFIALKDIHDFYSSIKLFIYYNIKMI